MPSPFDSFSKSSPFAPILATVSDTGYAVILGTFCGLTLVFTLLLSVLCFLRKKVSESTSGDSIAPDGDQDDNNSHLDVVDAVTLADSMKSSHHEDICKVNNSIEQLTNDHEITYHTTIENETILSESSSTTSHTLSHNIVTINNALNCNQKWIGQDVYIPDLPLIFPVRHADNDLLFQMEFDSLPETFADRTCISSDLPVNIDRNRYSGIKSFDETRVHVTINEKQSQSDYINANFVHYNQKLYICAQGPLENTIDHFWLMIYQQNVNVCVMLCNMIEDNKIKCNQYWSDILNEYYTINDTFNVILTAKRNYNDFIMRTFLLEYNNEKRQIFHFQYLLWNDYLANEQACWFIRFIRRVNEYYGGGQGPLLVHCSDGVGRTGTFVAIDSLIPVINSNQFVNIWHCVAHLRHERNFLVHSLKQYIFIYRAVMEYAQFGDTEGTNFTCSTFSFLFFFIFHSISFNFQRVYSLNGRTCSVCSLSAFFSLSRTLQLKFATSKTTTSNCVSNDSH